ncbi:amino acid ABC transporter ATP-binding/permease protein [Antarcticimicrobium sediminis]|uniref:ATP-binding cassette domain-containing protein n=1 Tax=Antarcticimicrobium sediminis TaxID=2546227 RepID=A0A4R5EMX2_9RHOB|nr:ATP-binding cassette domain-containing protein [Antarcticimicrobium sediminis]TDE35938.1 ATP-binding cassette domain-containing protein [Antarcticimicrobium sediminis]
MRAIWQIFRLLWAADPHAMWRGAALSVVVLIMGAALLGLSGWFITATGLAGVAGIGIAFDVFRPSAGVRFLALGRAGARYGERVLTHDATLRALAALRITLMRRLEIWPIEALRQLRGGAALTRITADVDALDGVALRLALPVAAALVTHVVAFAMLFWLVTPAVAVAIALGYLLGGSLILLRVALRTFAPSTEAEAAMQALRRRAIDLFRGQREAILQGLLPTWRARIEAEDSRTRAAQDRLDRIDTGAGLVLSAVVALVTALVLGLSGGLIAAGRIDPAQAAIGVFVALALAETILPLRRGLAEIGRMRDAAERVLAPPPAGARPLPAVGPAPQSDRAAGLEVCDLSLTRPGRDVALLSGVSFAVAPGQMLAISGASGTGKSTLLDALAGIAPLRAGSARLLGVPLGEWPEPALRQHLTLLPQRTALLGGTILENLEIARPGLTEDEAQEVLRAVALDGVIAERGGLEARLDEGGAGLSGGESRRLALARALLRRPDILLLDEPTEGLDAETARRVVAGIRAYLPTAAIVAATHREAEKDIADMHLDLKDFVQNQQ